MKCRDGAPALAPVPSAPRGAANRAEKRFHSQTLIAVDVRGNDVTSGEREAGSGPQPEKGMTVNAALALDSRCRSSSNSALAAPHLCAVNTFEAAGSKKSGRARLTPESSLAARAPALLSSIFNELFQA